MILTNVVLGLFTRTVTGDIDIEELTAELTRTVRHLLAGRAHLSASVGENQ